MQPKKEQAAVFKKKVMQHYKHRVQVRKRTTIYGLLSVVACFAFAYSVGSMFFAAIGLLALCVHLFANV